MQLAISVVLSGLDSSMQVWSLSIRQDTGKGSERNDKEEQRHGKTSKQLTIQGLFILEKG